MAAVLSNGVLPPPLTEYGETSQTSEHPTSNYRRLYKVNVHSLPHSLFLSMGSESSSFSTLETGFSMVSALEFGGTSILDSLITDQ